MPNTLDFSDLIPKQAAGPAASASSAALDFSDLIPAKNPTAAPPAPFVPHDLSAPSGDPLGDLENFAQPGDMSAPLGKRVTSTINAAANRLSLGFAPRAGAAFDAATGRAPSYADALASRNSDQDAAKTDLGTAGYTAMEMAGGTLLPFGLLGDAARGASLGGKIAIGGGTGAGIGAVQGAASSPDLSNIGQTAWDAGKGAATGAAFGAGLPIAGAVTGGAARMAAPFFADRPDGMSRTVFGLLGGATRPSALNNLDTLGPDAMLADASPSFTGLAQGAAGRDSEARDLLVSELQNRDAGTPYRLMADRYANFGHAISPDQAAQSMGQRMDATGPMYAEALNNAGPIDITPVSQDIARRSLGAANGGKTQGAMDQFETLISGPVVHGRSTLEYDPQILQSAKGEMDDAITALREKAGTSASNRQLAAMTGVRSNLDGVMSDQIPGFANANLAYGTAARGQESFTRGRDMLGSGDIWAGDHAAAFGQLPLEQQALERAGARSTIEQAALDSPYDLIAQRRIMGDPLDTKRGKNETYFGPDATQSYADSIDRNAAFRNTYQQVALGSKTQPASASAKAVDAALNPAPSLSDSAKLSSKAAQIGEQLVRGSYRAIAGISSDAQRTELARALSAIGPERDAIVNPLAEALRQTDGAGSGVNLALSNPGALGAALAAYGQPPGGRRAIR